MTRKKRPKGFFFRVSPEFVELLKRIQRQPLYKDYSQSDLLNIALATWTRTRLIMYEKDDKIFTLAGEIENLDNKFHYYEKRSNGRN